MKKLAAALLAASVTVPMLSYAQSPAPFKQANTEAHNDYGPSVEGSVQSGWTTQPSPQALRQSLYMHH
ncbi:hypothetical protein NOV72_00954 [Caballeronia novacaledonica]|uniref:Lipoprotein n=1 Tax=Caballeronia novacaledonica TaxID=1544861 RepID=A0A2U3I0R1_9BURK|nr:hypothetical protein [Caballeronia novacaledonica]SPB13690.1 hypothetical protein NOV72_00954 [Caballeronia novacaledonica]